MRRRSDLSARLRPGRRRGRTRISVFLWLICDCGMSGLVPRRQIRCLFSFLTWREAAAVYACGRTDGRTATVAKLRHHALPVGTETNLSISGLLASCNWGMTINGGFALLRIPLWEKRRRGGLLATTLQMHGGIASSGGRLGLRNPQSLPLLQRK